jgi:hypothetical protein
MAKKKKAKRAKAKQQKAEQSAEKVKYRVRNWSEYNKSLVQRGSLTLWVDEEVISAWKPEGPRQRGGQYEYSDLAIECMLTLRSVYRLSLRATEGFARSLFELMGLALPVPNYSTLSRRAKTLSVKLPKQAKGPLHIAVDSTGLKIYGEGEWKVRKHGYSKRRTWRKLHLAVDVVSGEIQAIVLSEASLDDAGAMPDLLNEIAEPIEQVDADGAYDKRKVYETCVEHDVDRIVIPPRKDAQLWPEEDGPETPHPRNQNMRTIEEIGRKQWKQQSAYHQRSLSETAMFRLKVIFGDTLQSRGLAQQMTEARIRAAALNRMTHLGMPDSYAVAA